MTNGPDEDRIERLGHQIIDLLVEAKLADDEILILFGRLLAGLGKAQRERDLTEQGHA
jgi:hypothetical protein